MRPGRRELAAWCLYDFANSAFTTVIVTTVFSVYFVRTVVPPGRISGELLWSAASSASLLIAALLSPVLGALADALAWKRVFLIGSSFACIAGTALLAGVGPGDVAAAIAAFVAANVGFEVAYVFYNGFLPEIAPSARAGRVSGYGWACGYIGGLVSLAAALVPLRSAAAPGAPAGSIEAASRLCFLLVAAHFLIFAIPAFWVLRDRPAAAKARFDPLEPLRRVRATLGSLGGHSEAFKFILANLVYNDGIVTIFAFAGIYMDRVLGYSASDIVMLVLVLNVPSAAGSFVFGHVSDRIGGRRAIFLTLAVLLVAILALVATAPPPQASAGQIRQARIWFWIVGMAVGAAAGANQSASRGLMALLVPKNREAEYFGFYIFSGKLSSVAAPLTYGLVVQATGSNTLGILSVGAFLLGGAFLLFFVDESRGIAQAGR